MDRYWSIGEKHKCGDSGSNRELPDTGGLGRVPGQAMLPLHHRRFPTQGPYQRLDSEAEFKSFVGHYYIWVPGKEAAEPSVAAQQRGLGGGST